MVFSAQWAGERANWVCSERVQCAPKRVCVCFFTSLCGLDSFQMLLFRCLDSFDLCLYMLYICVASFLHTFTTYV